MGSIAERMLGAGIVRVWYGANGAEASVAGLTIDEVRRLYSVVIHVPIGVASMVNGHVASGDYVLSAGDQLEFFKEAGVHG